MSTMAAVVRALDPFVVRFARGIEEAWQAFSQALVVPPALHLASTAWTHAKTLRDVTITWPEGHSHTYPTVETYSNGTVTLGLAEAPPSMDKGRLRSHVGLIRVGPRGGLRPVTYFVDADDFAQTHERVSVIRGKNGGKDYYRPGDQLPAEYDGMTIATLRDRIARHWNVACVVAKEGDNETMLNHGAAQVRHRGL